ncbi:bifunctional 4-hydroxy-2-oxoglutarate aldolase/2-dehydro-3-deoxy-phosphogluconate aldolase [Litorilinea aerophila]|nr:bifunctional 4-hydroxy-2-oxoglutarate aldolase/2-dehydro-3-deoxy-phosphogluconate aldolase [Litorilinea aerophila]MCC9077979.1 bifunctional 4-hydroxy-2-oxoglutarate aldolase/2-dehydro-3-deoxy-phosphogluconate aldolase [Litorilinea aerophila]GIV76667.1 MAG: 2-dehydro-3-deoxy-phosphogluconate aldolase [Litorilinea sp.]
MPTNIDRHLQQVCQEGLIAIVRGNFPTPRLLEIADTLQDAGVLVMEVTLNTTGALDAIARLRERFGDRMLVGAGTVRTRAQFEEAVAAGAQFTVAPNLDLATVEQAQARDVLHLPGIFTPTEAETAYRAGCKAVKLFPSDVVGPKYLKALRAPLDDILFIPTGGVTPENVGDYIRAGAAAVGLGSALVTGPDQSREDLMARAHKIRQAWEEAKRP